MLEDHNTISATVSLCCAVLSFCCSLVIVLSVHYYPRKKNSYHLQLVSRLFLTDVGLSSCIIVYFVIQYALTTDQLFSFCKIYLPTVVYFFILSYCWTILLALRFLMSKKIDGNASLRNPISFKTVWLMPFIPAVADLVVAWGVGGITTVHSNSSDTNQSCTFNHDKQHGIIMDLLTFQLPMVAATIITIFYYAKAIISLKNAPQSVISRQIRKASGYVAVLLVVTLPNLVYNCLTIFDNTHKSRNSLLALAVFLSSSQGYLNFCVYVWSDVNMRQWLSKHHFCFRIFGGGMKEVSEDYILEVDIDSDEEDEDITSISKASATIDNNNSESSSNSNPLFDEKPSFQNLRDSVIDGQKMSKKSTTKSKGILITQSQSNAAKDNSVAFSIDLDRDRFVRFGEISTRYISTATPRGSETQIASNENDIEENL